MPIVYTKKVIGLDSYKELDGNTDVVFKIYWSLIGEEDGIISSCPVTTFVPYTAGSKFVPYDQLTEELVLGWIDTYTTPTELQQYQNTVASVIYQNSIEVSPPLPWVPPEPPEPPVPPAD